MSFDDAWLQSVLKKPGYRLVSDSFKRKPMQEVCVSQDKRVDTSTLNLEASERQKQLLPPGAAMGTSLPLRLTNTKSRHEHWTRQAQRTKIQRQYVFEHLMHLWEDGPLLGLPLVITLTRIAPRALDTGDNLPYVFSACRDAVSDWLCGHYLKGQDRQDGLEWMYQQKRIAPHFYSVEIRVERPKKGT